MAAVCTDGTCGTTDISFSGILSTRARSGDLGDFLNLHIQASASGTARLFPKSASASVDPFLFVDPDFPNASLYGIIVSPGVGNAQIAAVPEEFGPVPASVQETSRRVQGLRPRRTVPGLASIALVRFAFRIA